MGVVRKLADAIQDANPESRLLRRPTERRLDVELSKLMAPSDLGLEEVPSQNGLVTHVRLETAKKLAFIETGELDGRWWMLCRGAYLPVHPWLAAGGERGARRRDSAATE